MKPVSGDVLIISFSEPHIFGTTPKSAKTYVWDVLIKNIKRLNRISKRRKNDSRQAFKNGFNTLSGNLMRQEQGRETDFNQMLIIQKVRNFWLYNISYWNQFKILRSDVTLIRLIFDTVILIRSWPMNVKTQKSIKRRIGLKWAV